MDFLISLLIFVEGVEEQGVHFLSRILSGSLAMRIAFEAERERERNEGKESTLYGRLTMRTKFQVVGCSC